MNVEEIQNFFKAVVVDSIALFPEGVGRYQVFTPFHFDDGDHFVILLRNEGGNLFLTDEGHTYMHMSYHTDLSTLNSESRNKLIENALDKYGVVEQEGQLVAQIDAIPEAGNVLYNFIQCLISITNVSYLSRERVASNFMENFKQFISESVSSERFQFDYQDISNDPDKKYLVDCRINGMTRPLHIYAIGNDDKCRDTTITILQFQKWRIHCFALSIFEDQEKINRKALSRLTDVCDRQFSSLFSNKNIIKNFIEDRSSNYAAQSLPAKSP